MGCLDTGRASLMDERGDGCSRGGGELLEGQEEGTPSRTGWRRRWDDVGMQLSSGLTTVEKTLSPWWAHQSQLPPKEDNPIYSGPSGRVNLKSIMACGFPPLASTAPDSKQNKPSKS